MKIVTLVEDTSGNNLCQYEHGLSFYVETNKHKLLVDSGATDMFIHNAKLLNVDLTQVDTLILSHGHYDHSGGILPFASLNPKSKIYMKDCAGEDYYHIKGEEKRYIGIDKEILKLPQLVTVKGDLEIDDELFLYSGIYGTKYPAKGNLELKKKVDDTYIQDIFEHEQCLVISQDNRKILISGCAHNGILNILDRYYEIFNSNPDIVISGFHMMKKGLYSNKEIEDIEKIALELMKTDTIFYTGHCTGQPAYNIMKDIMKDKLQLIHSGFEIMR